MLEYIKSYNICILITVCQGSGDFQLTVYMIIKMSIQHDDILLVLCEQEFFVAL